MKTSKLNKLIRKNVKAIEQHQKIIGLLETEIEELEISVEDHEKAIYRCETELDRLNRKAEKIF